MFSQNNRFLAYIKRPSIFNLRKMMTVQQRKQIIKKQLIRKNNFSISAANLDYQDSYQLALKQRQQELMKYEKSILWSPKFTPKHFKWFVIYALLVAGLMFYLRYFQWPKNMLYLKIKYGIKFPTLEGWLEGWIDEYRNPDNILQFQAYSLSDMERLYKEGVLIGGNKETMKKQQEKAQKKKSKFVRGSKQFVLGDFKST